MILRIIQKISIKCIVKISRIIEINKIFKIWMKKKIMGMKNLKKMERMSKMKMPNMERKRCKILMKMERMNLIIRIWIMI